MVMTELGAPPLAWSETAGLQGWPLGTLRTPDRNCPPQDAPSHAVKSHSQTAIRMQKEVFTPFISIFISFFKFVFANVL